MAESIRILILEDNQADAELTQFELQEAGLVFIPKVVTTKKDYVRELQEFSPDLILSDYDLPQFNGVLALAEARKRRPDTPFILVTGAVSEDRAIEILTQGAKDYVLKNRLQQRLVPAVKRALGEAEEQKARKRAEEELRDAHKNLERQVAQRTAELQKQIDHSRQIEDALLKYNERLELLSYTASQLLASDKPQQLVEELCLKVMEFLDCDTFFNFLVDGSTGRLHLNACAGIPPETVREIEWLDFGTAVCGCVARDGCRIVAENIPETPDVRTELIKSFGIKAYACHPLMQQKRVIGTLSFGTRRRTTFSADDLAMMKAVTDQVAIAMSRVRIEEALRESEFQGKKRVAEMQAVMDTAPVAVWIAHDPQCLRITGNRNADEIMQISPDSNISAGTRPGEMLVSFKVFREGKEMKAEELPVQVAATTGRPVAAEMLDLVFTDGRVVSIMEGAMPLFDPDGRVRGSVAAGTDVTRLRQAEEALRHITERFEMAQHAAGVGTWDWDIVTGHVEWSAEMFNLFRLDPQKNTVSFDLWKSIFHPEDVKMAITRMDEALRQKTILNSDYRIVLPDGQIGWINSIGEGKYDNEGRPTRMIGICVDITERKRAENKLRENQSRLEAVFAAIPDVILEYDNNGEPVRANLAALKAAGLTSLNFARDEVVAKLNPRNLDGSPVMNENLSISRALRGETVAGDLYTIVTADGIERVVSTYATPIYKDDKVSGVVALWHDITELKRTEEALRESEERYRQIIRYAPAGIYEIDFATGHFTEVNNAMCRILGYTRDEFLTLSAFDILDDEGIARFRSRISLGRLGQEPEEAAEYRVKTKDGRFLWALVHATFRWDGGRIVAAVVVAHDITERKNREKEQEKFTRMLRALSKSNQAMIRATDERGYTEEVCKIVVEDCGHSMVWIGFAEDDEGKTVRPTAHSGFEEGYIDALKVTWADAERGRGPTGTAIRAGKPVLCRDMLTDPRFEPWREEAIKRGYASSVALPMMTYGKAFGAITIYSKEPDSFTEDEVKLLTELADDLSYGIMMIRWRKACSDAEKALKESEEKYRNLVKYAPAAIYEMDLPGTKFLSVNDVMCDMIGYSREELLAMNPSDFLDQESRALFKERIKKQFSGEKIDETVEYHVRRKDGQWIYVSVNIGTITYTHEESPRVAVIAHDITHRKQIEQSLAAQTARLEELNRELESFSYSVSHDLRAPLRAIDGFSHKLEREYGDKSDEKLAGIINHIRSNAKIMGNLIDDLLAFSRVQKAGMSVSIIDMAKLAGEVWNEIRAADKRRRKLEFKITKILPGHGDHGLIRQVLFNLLDNAVKFTGNKKQGIIEMTSYIESGNTVYRIKDNGAGFDMEYYDKLFGVFQRLHSTEEYEGTGVGLAIVQRIVSRHGGRVWAEGKVGKGATFFFTLASSD